MRQRSFATRAVIGFVATALIGVVGFFGTRLAQGAFAPDYRVSVTVGETGQGIIGGSDVVARGVIVGRVGDISLDEDLQAVVELILEDHYTIPADAVFAITGKTLLGEKQVEILFDGPFGADEALADGALVDDPDQVVELQDVLQDLDELFGAIDPNDLAIVVNDGLGAFVGQDAVIARAVDQGARATDVFSRSLDDQIAGIRDLSLVAETLSTVGGEFNRMGLTIDLGALDTITANQARLQTLLVELNRFSDQFDLVLRLTRADLDRMIIQGDNVTRMLFAYRPELADLLVGVSDYSDTIGNGGLSDPGFTGLGAGFQIILEEDPIHILCDGLPPELGGILPVCEGEHGGEDGGEGGGPQPPAPPGAPEIPLPELPVPAPQPPVTSSVPVLEVPAIVRTQPETPVRGGLDAVLDGLLSSGLQLGGGGGGS